MAKKTEKNNKTKHVLSLLTAEKDSHTQENETQERKAEPAAPASVVAGEKQESAPRVTVIDSNERMQDQLSEMIGEELERALEEELQEDGLQEDGLQADGFQAGREQNTEPPAAESAAAVKAEPEPVEKETAGEAGTDVPGMAAEENTVSGENEADAAPAAKASEEAPGGETAAAEEAGAGEQERKEAAADAADAVLDGQKQDTDYVFFNVMRAIVEDGLEENLKRFDACTCPRCRMDAMAIALNRLTPKYVVVDRGAVSALKDVYEKKYMADTLVAMVQACIEVAKNPRH